MSSDGAASSPPRPPTVGHSRRARPVGRVVSAPLWSHLVVLALVVVAFVALSHPGTGFTSDEGAAISQARLLRDDGTWHYRYPLEWMDDSTSARPFIRADVGSRGIAPYAKHPTYPVLLRLVGADAIGGLALSVVGTVLAALMAALLARRLSDDEMAAVVALWLTGIATPLLFEAGLLLAHTLAAAAFGAAAVLSFRATGGGRRRWVWLAGAMVAALAASLLRTEGVLAVAGLAVGVVVVLRSRWSLLVGGALAAVAAGGVLLDRWLQPLIVGVAGIVPGNTVTTGLLGRWDGFYVTWLSTSSTGRESSGTILWIALGAIAVAAVLRRTDRISAAAFASVAGLGAAAYVLQFVVRSDVLIPGLLVTVPVLWGMAWFVDRRDVSRDWWIALVTCGVGVIAIIATQYSIGGGVEWGGRYFAVLLPVVVAVVVTGSIGALRRLLPSERGRATVVGAAAVVTLVLAGIALTTLRQGHQWADQLSRGVAGAAASAGPTRVTDHPIVMTSNRLLPQLLYDDVDRYDWVAADAGDLPGFAEQLAAAGADTAVLVVPTGSDLPARLANTGWTVRAEDTPAVYDIFVLERPER
jgi:MFS family permease